MLFCLKWAIGGEPIAVFDSWYFFKYVNAQKQLMCYIMSIPKTRYDNFENRGESFFTVIKEKDAPDLVIYLSIGENYNKKIISADIDIVRHKFPIFTIKDKGWAYNKRDDNDIIDRIKRALFFNITVSFENEKNLLDVYSANGFAEAIDYLTKNCY